MHDLRQGKKPPKPTFPTPSTTSPGIKKYASQHHQNNAGEKIPPR